MISRRWVYEQRALVGARAEMLRVRSEPADGPLVGQVYHYVDDYDLDGAVDVGSTTKLEGQPDDPLGSGQPVFSSRDQSG